MRGKKKVENAARQVQMRQISKSSLHAANAFVHQRVVLGRPRAFPRPLLNRASDFSS